MPLFLYVSSDGETLRLSCRRFQPTLCCSARFCVHLLGSARMCLPSESVVASVLRTNNNHCAWSDRSGHQPSLVQYLRRSLLSWFSFWPHLHLPLPDGAVVPKALMVEHHNIRIEHWSHRPRSPVGRTGSGLLPALRHHLMEGLRREAATLYPSSSHDVNDGSFSRGNMDSPDDLLACFDRPSSILLLHQQ